MVSVPNTFITAEVSNPAAPIGASPGVVMALVLQNANSSFYWYLPRQTYIIFDTITKRNLC